MCKCDKEKRTFSIKVHSRATKPVFSMFDSAKSALLSPPALINSSCWGGNKNWLIGFPAPGDVIKALFILALSTGIVVGNLVMICVLNSRRYTRYIDNQPRYLLTSLALNDLFTGVLVAPIALLPALYRCWPYGEVFCQIQALLRGALSQQSAVILVCMAIDRYMCLLHPETYYKHSSKKGCVLVISVTWVVSVSLFAAVVLPSSGYYFNSTGLMACDVFHSRIAFRILTCCAYYFPTTMALMYCYGSGFHVNKMRLKDGPLETHPGHSWPPAAPPTRSREPASAHPEIGAFVRQHSASTSRTMAAMSLGFIVMVTPATIQEVVAACTGCKVPPTLDFIVTWLALSNSFWNPFLYWLLNAQFRRIGSDLMNIYFCCRKRPTLPGFEKNKSCCSSVTPSDGLPPSLKNDVEGLSEKYWGEILERTVSSSSLHALQKACHANREEVLQWNGSLNNFSSHKPSCNFAPRCIDSYAPSDCRNFSRGIPFQVDVYGRPGSCRLKNSDFCLYKNHESLDFEHSRSNLSLDEVNFNKCNGRLPDL